MRIKDIKHWPWRVPHFFHNYQLLLEEMVSMEYETKVFKHKWTEQHLLHWEKCEICGKQKVYLISLEGKKRKIEPAFIKHMCKDCE